MLSKQEMPQYSLLGKNSQSLPNPTDDGSTVDCFRDGSDADEEWISRKRDLQVEDDKPFYQRHFTAILVHASIALCYAMLGAAFLLQYKGNRAPSLIPSPLRNIISYKTDVLTDNLRLGVNGTVIPDENHEFGPPSPELDAAWANMLQYSNVRLFRDELSDDYRDNHDLAELSDGSGIYGSIAVFHSIHCIKRLRFLLYADHYHANATEDEMNQLKQHGEHCLSYLLHSAKCNADLTVFPMQWGTRTRIPFGIDQGHHQCKNWNGIQDWAKERSFDIYEPGLLNHPHYGWAYSDGVDKVTGVSANDSLLAQQEHGGHSH